MVSGSSPTYVKSHIMDEMTFETLLLDSFSIFVIFSVTLLVGKTKYLSMSLGGVVVVQKVYLQFSKVCRGKNDQDTF